MARNATASVQITRGRHDILRVQQDLTIDDSHEEAPGPVIVLCVWERSLCKQNLAWNLENRN